MPFLTTPNMDLLLLLFVLVALLRYSLFKEKAAGLKWVAAGGLLILVPVSLYAVNWNLLGLANTMRQVDTFLSLAGALVILVGIFKLLQELFSR